jgi:16S rRNA C1402 N4-methylase RsmH
MLFNKRSPHLHLAHSYWKKILQPGDSAVDATCGNGHDASILLSLIGSGGVLHAIDLQEVALERARVLLSTSFPEHSIYYHCQSHETFPDTVPVGQIRLIVYNLGYLPGGDKRITTMTHSSLESFRQALNLLIENGVLSIMCYPGHEEGLSEQKAILNWAASLPPHEYHVCHHQFINRPRSPTLLLIEKGSFLQ